MLNHRHVNGEPFRPHLDEVARMAGLGYIVNPLLNEQLEIMDLVAGDVTAAFERGCELGAQRYATPMPAAGSIDVGVFNAFHVSWFRHWDELVERLTAIHGSQAKAALFPAGALQMAEQ